MDKDAVYFPHFSNARNDRKIRRITKELGVEGYGIFFMLLEVLRDQTDLRYPLGDLDLLADEFGTSEQKVRAVVCNYQLFDVDEQEMFFSPRMLVFLKPLFDRREQAKIAAKKRWENQRLNASALPEHCYSNASKVKESKVKESKVKKKNANIRDIKNRKYYSLCEQLRSHVESVSPHFIWKESFMEAWANTFRLMVERDGRTEDFIGEVIDAVSRDKRFWSKNILSADKLRLRLNEGKLSGLFESKGVQLDEADLH